MLKFLSAREPVLVPDEWHHATHLRPRTAEIHFGQLASSTQADDDVAHKLLEAFEGKAPCEVTLPGRAR